MRIGRPLLKLPVRFSGDALAREVSALPANAWMDHPAKLDGNIAVPLVSPRGALTNDAFGPMGPTPWLGHCRYILEIMQALDCTWGRSRLMGLSAGAQVPEHVDVHYYWRTHLRVHIPVITNPDVAFTGAGEAVHMAAGECWILDSFFPHSVANRGTQTRIHLVLDTVGSAYLWDLVHAARAQNAEEQLIEPGQTMLRPMGFEQINAPAIMSPWEMKAHVTYISDWTDEQAGREEVLALVDRFVMAWSGTWARFGPSDAGLALYAGHLAEMEKALSTMKGPPVTMRNGLLLVDTIGHFILGNAIAPAMMQRVQRAPAPGLGLAPYRKAL
ncbi:MAG: aspartyl/asparaginyl beta-hydroxylase domain-containing protein [Sphingomonas sp.]